MITLKDKTGIKRANTVVDVSKGKSYGHIMASEIIPHEDLSVSNLLLNRVHLITYLRQDILILGQHI